jgi:hypothetical protein
MSGVQTLKPRIYVSIVNEGEWQRATRFGLGRVAAGLAKGLDLLGSSAI